MEAASEVFGLCRRKQPDWFLASSATLLPALADKRAARLSVLQDRNDSTIAHYRKARNDMKCLTRQAYEQYWQDLSEKVEWCASTGDIPYNYLSLTSWMRRSQQWKSSVQLQLWRITSHRAAMEFQRSCWSVAGQCWSGGFTACFDAVGRTNASLANLRMPTSSLFIKTRVTGRTATTIEASHSLAFRENALPVQSSQDCSALLTRC